MERLTDKERWDTLYETGQVRPKDYAAEVNLLRKGLGKYFCPYYDYFLWDVIFKKYLLKTERVKVLEVGSAPGDFLVRLNKTYGFIPYGVEYSEPGVIENRKVFSSHNINPDNVIHADFFDDKFHQNFRGYFDIVISRGFLEHFTDVEYVIEKHLNVLNRGGYLIVSIPNLNHHSFYGALSPLLHRERLKMHNLDIMTKEVFTRLFDRKDLSTLFCDYYGTLHLGMLSAGNKLMARLVVSACCRLQRLLNPILYFLLRDKGAESRYFSPMLLYIGLKRNCETISDDSRV